MRWPWQRVARTSASAQPRLLPSATEGVSFEAVYTITWRPRWRNHPNTEEVVRTHVHTTATQAAAHLDIADLPAAQDAVNAALAPLPRLAAHYRLLTARADLRLPAATQELLAQRQVDEHRIRRLHFLKENLYDHPDLLVLDRLEHHAPGAMDDNLVAELQRLARLIRSCDRWWLPVLEEWEALGQGFKDVEMQQRAMIALLDAVKGINGGCLPASLAHLEADMPTDPLRPAHP